MTLILNEDLIQSITDALQYISYYHPLDFVSAVNEAYEKEESPAAKDAMAQSLLLDEAQTCHAFLSSIQLCFLQHHEQPQ